MSDPVTVIVAVLALAALYVLLPRIGHIFSRYRDTRTLPCPETGVTAEVTIDASHAAFTSAFGQPRLRTKGCSLWPARKDCGRSCLHQPGVETP